MRRGTLAILVQWMMVNSVLVKWKESHRVHGDFFVSFKKKEMAGRRKEDVDGGDVFLWSIRLCGDSSGWVGNNNRKLDAGWPCSSSVRAKWCSVELCET